MMNEVLHPFIDKNVAICYMDNILVFTETLDEHHKAVHEILLTLRQHKLFLKPEKCSFEKSSVHYLGLIISRGSVAMDPVKVHGITDWPTPQKVKDVQLFLGFVNFYHWFILNFANIACPLHALTHKKWCWLWGDTKQKAFDVLKTAVTLVPTLVFPSKSGAF